MMRSLSWSTRTTTRVDLKIRLKLLNYLDLPQTRVDLNYNKIGGQITNVMTKSLPNDKLLLIMLLIGHYDSIHDTLLNSRFKKKKLDFLLVFCPSLGGGQCGLATLTQLFSEAR